MALDKSALLELTEALSSADGGQLILDPPRRYSPVVAKGFESV